MSPICKSGLHFAMQIYEVIYTIYLNIPTQGWPSLVGWTFFTSECQIKKDFEISLVTYPSVHMISLYSYYCYRAAIPWQWVEMLSSSPHTTGSTSARGSTSTMGSKYAHNHQQMHSHINTHTQTYTYTQKQRTQPYAFTHDIHKSSPRRLTDLVT